MMKQRVNIALGLLATGALLLVVSLLADMIVEGCVRAREASALNVCALSGGTFQNMLLLDLCRKRLLENGFRVLIHSLVPANDGGISLGQALAGSYRLKNIHK